MWVILALILGFALGLYVSHKSIVVPLWDTEEDLRKALKELRADLYRAQHGSPILTTLRWVIETPYGLSNKAPFTDEPPVPHRVHSDVLYIPNPEDLLR